MLKYVDYQLVFREIPDTITLAINLSGCPFKCKGCHSSYLQEDLGVNLSTTTLDDITHNNNCAECICFMGGDAFVPELNMLLEYIKKYHNKKTAWYSGSDEISKLINFEYLDYYKIGSYKEELGPLNSETTNQVLYELTHEKDGNIIWKDITKKLRK